MLGAPIAVEWSRFVVALYAVFLIFAAFFAPVSAGLGYGFLLQFSATAPEYRTVVYKVKDYFLPVVTISTTNLSDEAIPLQQDLSRTQTISASVNGSKKAIENEGIF